MLYDGAHAFGSRWRGRSLLAWGNATAVSFHATKLFHTIEGGAVITDDPRVAERVDLLRAFGHEGDDHYCSGINAKASEAHAAMGLCLLPRMDAFLAQRQRMHDRYRLRLRDLPLSFQQIPEGTAYNYAYFPILLPSHAAMLHVKRELEVAGIYTRRYFSPSLNRLPYVQAVACPVAEDVADRVLCLPFFQEITAAQVERVTDAVRAALASG